MRRLVTSFAALLFVLCLGMGSAWACSVPNVFVNSTIADADQVNANFTAVLACVNVNLVVGPNSSTLNNVACFGNTAGSLLAACATIPAAQLPSIPASLLPAPASVSGSGGNPAGTTSTSVVMMGLGSGWTLTPNRSGKVIVMISGDIANSIAGNGFAYQIRYGTGAAPANGAAGTAGSAGSSLTLCNFVSGGAVPFAAQFVASGMTLGVVYWFDLALAQSGGGTASLTNLTVSALES